MKKQLFVLSVLAGMTLAGCSLFGPKTSDYGLVSEFASGKKAEKVAVLEAVNNLSPAVKKDGGDLFSDEVSTLKEDKGDYVKVTKKQVYNDLTVELEWETDTKQATYRTTSKLDDEHDAFELNFPGFGGADTEFKWTLKSAKCGSCVTKDTWSATYTAKLKGYSHKHVETSIAQINAVTDGEQTINGVTYPSTFDMVDYTLDKPYFKKVEGDVEPDYYYVCTKGKIIYYAPDGNWMLLGDGKQVVEVYAGSALDLNPQGYPAIQTGAYVQVDGNLSQYNGNIQIGFVSKVLPIEKGSIADPVLNETIDEAFIGGTLELGSGKPHKQAIDGFSNSICAVSGTVKTVPNAPAAGARFTFVLTVGSKELTVAYDYHTDKDGSQGLFNKIKAKLTVGASVTLKGTMRYAGHDSDPFKLGAEGEVWNIVPFLAADVQ